MNERTPQPSWDRLLVDVELSLDRFKLEVSFETQSQVTGVFGASGSGKTSLLETLSGLRKKAKGTLQLGDETWLSSGTFLGPEDRNIGYVPQEGLLFPHLTVQRNLETGKKRALASGHDFETTLAQVVEILELSPLLNRGITTLSGGERQRVALGRAICSGPRLLLLDEPFASLDLPLRRRLLPFLNRVRHEFQIPMILVTHDPIEVQALCDDLIVLKSGKVLVRGEPRRVLSDPKVFSLADRSEFENILPCHSLGQENGASIVELGDPTIRNPDPPVRLVVTRSEGNPGDRLFLGIPSHEIMIATQKPVGLSARNLLPARILSLKAEDAVGIVTVSLTKSLPPLAIEVTETTISSLGLQPDLEIFLVIKAASCRLYNAGN